MNYRTMAVAIIGILSITAIGCFSIFVRWQTGAEQCAITTKMQHELMVMACKQTIEETLINIDKEFCATWDAELELERLENSGVKKK